MSFITCNYMTFQGFHTYMSHLLHLKHTEIENKPLVVSLFNDPQQASSAKVTACSTPVLLFSQCMNWMKRKDSSYACWSVQHTKPLIAGTAFSSDSILQYVWVTQFSLQWIFSIWWDKQRKAPRNPQPNLFLHTKLWWGWTMGYVLI